MKKLLSCIILLGSISVLASSAFSQTSNQGPGQNQQNSREENIDELKTNLGLTDAQVSSWKALKEKYRPQYKAIRADSSLSEEARKTKMKSVRSSEDTELKTILTPDQYTKFQAWKEQQKQQNQQNRQNHH